MAAILFQATAKISAAGGEWGRRRFCRGKRKAHFAIVASHESGIDARGRYIDETAAEVFMAFRINRATGRTQIVGTHGGWVGPNGTNTRILWDLMCQPSRPLL